MTSDRKDADEKITTNNCLPATIVLYERTQPFACQRDRIQQRDSPVGGTIKQKMDYFIGTYLPNTSLTPSNF